MFWFIILCLEAFWTIIFGFVMSLEINEKGYQKIFNDLNYFDTHEGLKKILYLLIILVSLPAILLALISIGSLDLFDFLVDKKEKVSKKLKKYLRI